MDTLSESKSVSAKARKGKQKSIEIGGQVIAPGERKIVDLPISVLSNHTPVVLSALIINGRQPGPTMFVSAAVHGDELLGVEVIRRLVISKRLQSLHGTLIAVPVVNAFGFIAHSRYLPDRRDLNRSFPGKPDGSLAAQLAHLFLTEIVDRADFGIDLHTGAIHRTNLPQIRVLGQDESEAQRANAFGAPVVLKSSAPPGSLRAAVVERGKNILLYEAGEALRFDEKAIRVGLRGVLSVMRHEGMITGSARKDVTPLWLGSSQWVRAPEGGILQIRKPSGSPVKAGDVLAIVADPFGQTRQTIVSPIEGLVIGHTNLPTANRGDALLHVAATGDENSLADLEGSIEDYASDQQVRFD